MAEIYKDFLTQFNVPSTQFKMESKRTIHGHAPAFQCTAAYPMDKMADSYRGNAGKRRPPQKGQKRRNDIYVNRKTDFAAQLERCQKILDSSEQEVRIHGLGAAINRAINLALQLEQRGQGTVELSTATSSVKLVDDFEPEDDDHEGCSKVRTNSAVHIRVYKKPILPADSEGTSKNVT